jgi:type I site-specific restriction-modification system R (restriction) subunit
VDRVDLDTQISATFNAADVPNMIGVATRKELQELLGQDVRKVLITTIHKFAEAGGRLNERSNIIVMVDEAHRTQEGDLGRKMRQALPLQVQKCLAFFAGVDRTVGGYEGLSAAQQCLPNNDIRDMFAAEYCVLGRIWEALSPDPCLSPYQTDYKWLTQVYESVKPPSGNGKLLWHALGAKTVELINENIHLESVRDDIETLVLDTQVLEEILADAEPGTRAKEVEIKLIARLRKHLGNPIFTALGERLERIKERHEQGVLTSLQFLKEILELAKDVVEAEKQTDPAEERDKAKEALTELFNEAKHTNTHIIVERIVADIDEIVKKVRFPDWQHTSRGERLVQRELRRTLLKYKLHRSGPLRQSLWLYQAVLLTGERGDGFLAFQRREICRREPGHCARRPALCDHRPDDANWDDDKSASKSMQASSKAGFLHGQAHQSGGLA